MKKMIKGILKVSAGILTALSPLALFLTGHFVIGFFALAPSIFATKTLIRQGLKEIHYARAKAEYKASQDRHWLQEGSPIQLTNVDILQNISQLPGNHISQSAVKKKYSLGPYIDTRLYKNTPTHFDELSIPLSTSKPPSFLSRFSFFLSSFILCDKDQRVSKHEDYRYGRTIK